MLIYSPYYMTDLKKVYSIHFKRIHSTNSWAKEHARSLSPTHITYITADQQTAGRGSLGKSWLSPKGNIYASLFFTIPKEAPYLSNIGQLLSYSAALALEKLAFHPKIKWPNDLQIEGKKIGGILTETVPLNDRLGVVVGIGLNVNMVPSPLDQPATSLSEVSGQEWRVDAVMAGVLEEFQRALFQLETESFAPFHLPYTERLAYKDELITCQSGQTLLEGICRSVTKEGRLVLQLLTGETKEFASGEVYHVRKN
jgi:BirA family biotin operon repressor/biotin-[acetyl-CoA-carboxylase] ligase